MWPLLKRQVELTEFAQTEPALATNIELLPEFGGPLLSYVQTPIPTSVWGISMRDHT